MEAKGQMNGLSISELIGGGVSSENFDPCPVEKYVMADDDRLNYTFIKPENIEKHNPKQGEEWYRMKYPELPEDFYGIIARYQWGQPFTKKEVKNTTKKIRKNNKKDIPQGFSMVKGNFEISFD